MKNLLIFLLTLLSLSFIHAQYNKLQISDPQAWGSTRGSIDEAIISMKPQGIFMEYGLYLTFSAAASNFEGKAYDTLEVVLDFHLPAEAMIIDSWLWIYDDISKAILIDKWEASNIYEDIVDRRQDPSILTKKSATQYQLRVFPMAGNETRKVKINYLLPMDWQADKVTCSLPTHLLNTSKVPLQDMELIVWGNDALGAPFFVNGGQLSFQSLYNEEYGAYKYSLVPLSENLKVAFDSPLQNGYYLATTKEEDEYASYQLAVLPGGFTDEEKARKLIFMVDHDFVKSYVDGDELFDVLKGYMKQALTPADSFNLFVSSFQTQGFSNAWLAATEENIAQACNFGKEKLASYSNLVSLLLSGIEFANQDDEPSSFVLIANSDHYREYNLANDLLDDIMDAMDQEYPFHILDYQQKNLIFEGVGGVSYFGNEYFYTNLSHLTHGSFHSLYNSSEFTNFYDLLFKGLNDLNGLIHYFDFSTGLQNGFTFAKYDLHDDDNLNLSHPLLQVGKYFGELPFTIELNALVDDDFFHKELIIGEAEADKLDSTQNKIWAGLHLQEMEKMPEQNNALIKNIIENSMTANVLSLYTAFLCLEDTSQYCYDCIDETELVDVPHTHMDTLFLISPNPFRDVVNIRISGLNEVKAEDLTLQIFSARGELIKNFDPKQLKTEDEMLLTWDARETSNGPGMYFFLCRSEGQLYTRKLIRIRE